MSSDRGQSGASLVMVLAFVAFVSAVVPAVLAMSVTGLRITGSSTEARNELYAAGSAIELAIAAGTADESVGVAGEACPDTAITINGLAVVVSCMGQKVAAGSCHAEDRVTGYLAEVRKPGAPEVLASIASEVYFQKDAKGVWHPVVAQWDATADKMLTPGSPPCDAPATTTTVVPTTTTTTTTVPTTTSTVPPSTAVPPTTTWVQPTTTTIAPTTTVPVRTVTASWSASSVNSSRGRWLASGNVEIHDDAGKPLPGALVSVAVEYLDAKGTWKSAHAVEGRSDRDGNFEVESPRYKLKGKKAVSRIRFTIKEVEDPFERPWDPSAFPVSTTLLSP